MFQSLGSLLGVPQERCTVINAETGSGKTLCKHNAVNYMVPLYNVKFMIGELILSSLALVSS